MDFQIALLPHLISLKEGYGSPLKETDKYAEAGLYGMLSHPPFLPLIISFRARARGLGGVVHGVVWDNETVSAVGWAAKTPHKNRGGALNSKPPTTCTLNRL